MLPPKYSGAVMVGNGLSGIIIGIFRAITLLIFPSKEDEYYGARTYFLISALFLVVGLVA